MLGTPRFIYWILHQKCIILPFLLIVIFMMYGYALGVTAKALIDINKDDERKDDK